MPILNSKKLKFYRRKLRNRSTSAESVMWTMLKSRNIEGKKFRRQYSIDFNIVDFCCPEEKIIIELDGHYHGDYHKIEQDKIRDEKLAGMGYRILRFENRIVFQDPEIIVNGIKSILYKK
jgi:very-short-patch-repair endonuclease